MEEGEEQAMAPLVEGTAGDVAAAAGHAADIAALSSIPGEEQWLNHDDADDGVELGDAEEVVAADVGKQPQKQKQKQKQKQQQKQQQKQHPRGEVHCGGH